MTSLSVCRATILDLRIQVESSYTEIMADDGFKSLTILTERDMPNDGDESASFIEVAFLCRMKSFSDDPVYV